MNHQHHNSSGEFTSRGAAETGSIAGHAAPALGETKLASVSTHIGRRDNDDNSSSRGPDLRINRRRRVRQPKQGGPPMLVTNCGGFLWDQLRSLMLFLKGWGNTPNAIAGQARHRLAGRIGLFGLVGALTRGAMARSNSTLGLRRQRFGAVRGGQTLRNKELGQLCQTQKWIKRYKTGMFANLAMLANVFSKNRPPDRSSPPPDLAPVTPARTTTPSYQHNGADQHGRGYGSHGVSNRRSDRASARLSSISQPVIAALFDSKPSDLGDWGDRVPSPHCILRRTRRVFCVRRPRSGSFGQSHVAMQDPWPRTHAHVSDS